MSKLEKAVADSGLIVFTMKYKPDFPIYFAFDENPFVKGKTALFGDLVHPDDFQPFCEIFGDVVNRRADKLSAHSRLIFGSGYHWFYISAEPDYKEDGSLIELNGIMYDVTTYLENDVDDAVMRTMQRKVNAAFYSAKHTPELLNVLGKGYLSAIQQPFTFIKGVYSQIVDMDGKVIACAAGQDEDVNLNKMSYQRKKFIRIKHQNAAAWVIASESYNELNKCIGLLDTMVQTVSELANSYIVISEEMENSQKANKLLGQNFEDQILINNIYSLILQSKNTTASFGSIIPLIKQYFDLDDLVFCSDTEKSFKVYRWDENGTIVPVITEVNLNDTKALDKELENYAVVIANEKSLCDVEESRDRSCALSRIYENGVSRGVIVFISGSEERVWTNRDRKLIKNITQIISTVIYRSFMENELAVSQENLYRLAYYNTGTGIPNRSAFERDFRELITKGEEGSVISIEIANLKELSEVYTCRYADEVTRSVAEYISAIRTDYEKHVYMFSNDILFVTLEHAGHNEAVSLAQVILSKFCSPWYLNDNENKLDIYAGVCMFPKDADCIPDCVRVATKTLRLAKDRKLRDVVCYSSDIEEKLDDNLRVRKLIMDALENDFRGFYYLYTPIINVKTGALESCEAHMFWGNGDVIVSRERILPIVDRMNMAFEFHKYALNRLCELCAEVRRNGYPDFKVSYTIPENILNSDDTITVLKKKFIEYDLTPDAIAVCVSQSERTLLENSGNLKMLSRLGMTIVADDKGENFFNGDILNNPYINVLKLRARRLNDDPVASEFVRTLITNAHNKNIQVCIKGVDNDKSLEYARRFNADTYQGIVNCRPLHTGDFIEKIVVNQR